MQPSQNPQVSIKQIKTLTPQEVESIALSEMYKRNDRVEIQKYYQEILEKSVPLFDRYAGKKRPVFEFTSDPKVSTAYFSVNEKGGNPEIKVGLEFFIQNKLLADQAVWVLMHELTHFTDYIRDRKTYMGQFENAKVLGVNMTDRLAEYFKSKNKLENKEVKELTEEQKKSLSNKISKIYSSGYYNIINDIYVNQNVATTSQYSHDKSKYLESKQGEVSKLYSEILFKERDFSAMPEFYQYLYFMLRGENVSEGMRVTEGVQVALAKDYEVRFKKYDKRRGFSVPIKKILGTQEVINTFLNPNSMDQLEGDEKEVRVNNQKDTSLKYRSEYVDSMLLPTFSDLLFDDLKDKMEDTTSESDFDKLMDWLKDILDKMEEGSPDFMPDEVLDRYAEWKEGDDAREAKETKPEQKPAPVRVNIPSGPKPKSKDEQMVDIIKNFAEKNNISPDVAARVAAARKDVSPYIDQLNELWKRIAMQQGSEATSSIDGEYKTGSEVNVDAFVRQFDRVIGGEFEKLRIMKRVEHQEKPSDRPERIEVSLILDQSASMGNKNSKLNKLVERVMLMLLTSLDNFNAYLDHMREQSKSKLHVDTEVILVADNSKIIKKFNGGISNNNTGIEKYKAFEYIGSGVVGGNNQDHFAFDSVRESMTAESKEKIKQGKVMKLVIEVTDGEPDRNAIPEMKNRINTFVRDGVLVFGIRVGGGDDSEDFKNVWNENPDGVQRGYVVGENYAKLPEMITKMLEEFLGEVKIYE